MNAATANVAQVADFVPDRLADYLKALTGATARLQLERTVGGMSNPTYFVRYGDWQAVLRKQPPSVLMPSAHAIDREYRVLSALHDSAVPVPQPIVYCADGEVLGTPFYLMEWLDGRIFYDYTCAAASRQERPALFDAMARTMATIHRLDFAKLGLADYGRPGSYFARQLNRWSQQWQSFRRGDDDNPALDALIVWLSERVPDSTLQTLCHGDCRIGNLMFHKSEPRVIGVLDWELSTLGHPLVDVAYNSQAWRMLPDENGGLLGVPLHELSIPTETDYLESYYLSLIHI